MNSVSFTILVEDECGENAIADICAKMVGL